MTKAEIGNQETRNEKYKIPRSSESLKNESFLENSKSKIRFVVRPIRLVV
jgi:hypothetical protein